jgi:mono/diheme cytochrome c family protein
MNVLAFSQTGRTTSARFLIDELIHAAALTVVLAGFVVASPARAQQAAVTNADAVQRGEYVFKAAGCRGCHTDDKNKGAVLAGGRALKTPFGVFYSPNITPDPTHGIGKWTDADFTRALREGVSPSGFHYYPALPYTAYTKMTDQDVRDLKAYIFALPAVAKENKPHELRFPYNLRFGVALWKYLNFRPGPLAPAPAREAEWQRGRYLVEALGHCAECHTERNFVGGLVRDKWMAGSSDGAEGESTPNITSDPKTGIGEWSGEEIAFALKIGMKPDGDSLGSAMAEVIEHGTSQLNDDDLNAIAAYLKSLPPVEYKPGAK